MLVSKPAMYIKIKKCWLQNQPYNEIGNKTSHLKTSNVNNSDNNIFIKHLFIHNMYTFQIYEFIFISKSQSQILRSFLFFVVPEKFQNLFWLVLKLHAPYYLLLSIKYILTVIQVRPKHHVYIFVVSVDGNILNRGFIL